MLFKNLVPATFLALVTATAAPGHADTRAVIDGQFRIQPYVLPNGQGYRHLTSFINEKKNELVLFGGLGNGPPSPPTPMNHNVYTLDLTKPPSQQEWENRGTDDAVAMPWFTSTNGFIQFDDEHYLACDDSDTDSVYSFNADTYKFNLLSSSSLDPDLKAGDCCAVGVEICEGNECGGKAEKRIYIMGGRNSTSQGPLSIVRYYSITHNKWEQVASMNVKRSHLGCAAVARGGETSIYAISGGDSSTGKSLRSMEVYDITRDKWTLYDNFGVGRTRFGARNVDDKYLLLIGGDANCTGGACPPDQPLRRIDIIDVRHRDPRFISSDDYVLPQLNSPRHSPATSLRKMKGNNQEDKYMLYVVGGRTRDNAGLGVLTTAEVLSFPKINPPK
ncbi:hypothetical protein WME73_47470 [Sorangium sp. So ce302]|uniref:hypothetical protein n=1 Tax=Sorangium sp. So ce302 TaxID=3133297 RepID=UPI003F5E2577